ncbi:MAG: chromate efflux transporter [Solirubrobacteraceae bacterium]
MPEPTEPDTSERSRARADSSSERPRARADSSSERPRASADSSLALATIAREWTRIGVTGFGGPPAHIALLRKLCVGRGWIPEREFEQAIAACNLLPGPASTQLAIYCARRLAGPVGALVGGLCFIAPAVAAILLLSALFLAHSPPSWIRGAGAGAGAAVAAVAVQAATGLLVPSWKRASSPSKRARWIAYVGLGAVGGAVLGPYLVLVLLGCGFAELLASRPAVLGAVASLVPVGPVRPLGLFAPLAAVAVGVGGFGALTWVAFKVGALSYGGGFVIIPLMQHDAVHTYHWMSSAHFLDAVALGQITPGPVVATVAAVGYAAHGVGGGLLAALIAFSPSFAFVLLGGGRFEALRSSKRAEGFLAGAGPTAIGAILGAAVPLAGALSETWQAIVLAAAAVALLLAHRGIVSVLVGSGVIGAIVALAGGPVPH